MSNQSIINNNNNQSINNIPKYQIAKRSLNIEGLSEKLVDYFPDREFTREEVKLLWEMLYIEGEEGEYLSSYDNEIGDQNLDATTKRVITDLVERYDDGEFPIGDYDEPSPNHKVWFIYWDEVLFKIISETKTLVCPDGEYIEMVEIEEEGTYFAIWNDMRVWYFTDDRRPWVYGELPTYEEDGELKGIKINVV